MKYSIKIEFWIFILLFASCQSYWDNPFDKNFKNEDWYISKINIVAKPQSINLTWKYQTYGNFDYKNTIERSLDGLNWILLAPDYYKSGYSDITGCRMLFNHDTIWYRISSYTYDEYSNELNRTMPKDTIFSIKHLWNDTLNLELLIKKGDIKQLNWKHFDGHISYLYLISADSAYFTQNNIYDSTWLITLKPNLDIEGFGLQDYVADTLFSIEKILNIE